MTFMKRNSHLLVHSRFRLSVISGSRPDSSPGDRFQLLSLGIGRMWQMLGSQVATHVQVEKVCFITETMSGRPAINAGSVEPTDWAAARSKRPHRAVPAGYSGAIRVSAMVGSLLRADGADRR